LFGNILVGGILLALLASVAHYFLPLPVMFFELFVAFLQATLFAVLTLFYIKMAVSEPH
jgi:F-type H+-transporting ATPase subunit a